MRRSAMHANMTAVEKKIYFLSFFSPLLFSSKRKVSVFDLYSISRIKRTEYIPMLRAYARKQSKKSRNCQSGHLLNFLSKTKEILGKRAFVLLSPRRQGGVALTFIAFLLIVAVASFDPLAQLLVNARTSLLHIIRLITHRNLLLRLTHFQAGCLVQSESKYMAIVCILVSLSRYAHKCTFCTK